MSDSAQSEKPKSGAESPTTRPELDFDDEPAETGSQATSKTPKSPSPPRAKVSFAEEEAPPAKPPRPLSPQQQAENTLIEAFPSIDAKVVKAVLVASRGQVEPAFNALLSMSDPNFKPEDAPPARPPRPTVSQSQVDEDERLARQLAQHFQTTARADRGPPLPQRPRTRDGDDDEDREHSFFDDDLPVIKENVRKGFLETQTRVNKWITDFRKRLDGEDNDDPYNGPTRQDSPPASRRQNFGSSQSEQLYNIRKSAEMGRKSTDRERYDADPHLLGDDFAALELRDEEATPSSGRPLGDPGLFLPGAQPPQSGPVDEVDAADRRASKQAAPGSASKSAKWQPLTSIAPNPESEEDDPFSLGDSDDEKESKDAKDSKTKDVREADTARLKEAARASVSGESGEAAKGLEAHERSGSASTKDRDAEAILTGKTS